MHCTTSTCTSFHSPLSEIKQFEEKEITLLYNNFVAGGVIDGNIYYEANVANEKGHFCLIECGRGCSFNMIDKRKHVLPKKRILLPNVIPWESGSNKFASLKGTLPFGGYRSIVPNIITPPYFKESEETSIPFLTCPPLKANIASQKGQRPFGSFRNEICCVTVGKDKKRVEDCMPNKVKNMAVLPKMRIPNKEAKRDEIFGHFRGQKLEVFGGPQLTEDNAKICDNTLPKFHDVQNTRAAEFKKNAQAPLFQSFVSDPKTEQQLSEQYRAWMGGQLTIKSDRPVNMKKSSNLSFFDKLMSEKDMTATELYYSKVDASELRDKLKIVEREQNDIDV